jgi:hypothetical protein
MKDCGENQEGMYRTGFRKVKEQDKELEGPG